MRNLDAYDDMMGLEYGSALDALMDTEMLFEALKSSAAGGSAILLAAWGVKKGAEAVGLESKVANPLLRNAILSGSTFLIGLLAGRAVMKYNMNAGIGIVGGVGGLALANFLDAAFAQATGSARMFSALGDSDMPMGSDDGMAALAALETTSVEANPGAFGMGDPTVTPEMLMGFDAAVVQQETLGGYAPYLA